MSSPTGPNEQSTTPAKVPVATDNPVVLDVGAYPHLFNLVLENASATVLETCRYLSRSAAAAVDTLYLRRLPHVVLYEDDDNVLRAYTPTGLYAGLSFHLRTADKDMPGRLGQRFEAVEAVEARTNLNKPAFIAFAQLSNNLKTMIFGEEAISLGTSRTLKHALADVPNKIIFCDVAKSISRGHPFPQLPLPGQRTVVNVTTSQLKMNDFLFFREADVRSIRGVLVINFANWGSGKLSEAATRTFIMLLDWAKIMKTSVTLVDLRHLTLSFTSQHDLCDAESTSSQLPTPLLDAPQAERQRMGGQLLHDELMEWCDFTLLSQEEYLATLTPQQRKWEGYD